MGVRHAGGDDDAVLVGSWIFNQPTNCDGSYTYGSGSKEENGQKTLPVDTFPPNPWGLYQVHGNVWVRSSNWMS